VISLREVLGLLTVLSLSILFPPNTNAADRPLLRLFDDSSRQPSAFHLGIDYLPDNAAVISTEGTRQKNGLADMEAGLEVSRIRGFAPRFGYRPEPGMPVMNNLAAGVRLRLFGERFVYACAPFHEGGPSHYLSLTKRFR
jgi:hypothetical protein